MKAWMKIACLGLLIGAYSAGCTITTDDDDEGIGGASVGGTAGTGGEDTDTGGTTTDSGGAAGAPATGGTAGTGGSTGPSPCETCLYDKCDSEMTACEEEDDSDDDGRTDCFHEYRVYQDCISDWADLGYEYFGSTDDPDVAVIDDCASYAAIYANDGAGPLTTTNNLINCTAPSDIPPEGDCYVECFDFLGAGGAGN
jgi:hypothetical protein